MKNAKWLAQCLAGRQCSVDMSPSYRVEQSQGVWEEGKRRLKPRSWGRTAGQSQAVSISLSGGLLCCLCGELRWGWLATPPCRIRFGLVSKDRGPVVYSLVCLGHRRDGRWRGYQLLTRQCTACTHGPVSISPEPAAGPLFAPDSKKLHDLVESTTAWRQEMRDQMGALEEREVTAGGLTGKEAEKNPRVGIRSDGKWQPAGSGVGFCLPLVSESHGRAPNMLFRVPTLQRAVKSQPI